MGRMNRLNWKSEALLFITAAIWGFAFIAQRAGMEHIGPFTFNTVRFALGSLFLVPLVLIKRRQSKLNPDFSETDSIHSWGPVIAGSVLFFGASLQQIGIVYTTAGKAGFITGLYVILVPIFGLIWKQKPQWGTWIGAILAAVGLYLLSFSGSFTISKGDLFVLFSAIFWACHVLVVGWLSIRMDCIRLACLQFATCSLLSLLAAGMLEKIQLQNIYHAGIPILYAGLLSTGIAYTLQVVAQKHVPSSNAAIIMSLEAVFAVLGGWLFLEEIIPFRGLVGCGIMLLGMLLSQLYGSKKNIQILVDSSLSSLKDSMRVKSPHDESV